MSNVIDFPVRHAPASPDDWLRHLFQDVLFAIREAKTLDQAREIAGQALIDMEGDGA